MSLVSALEAPLSISTAIRRASRATGADFSYLLNTAARESSFDKSAKAKTSSAAGLFQFIESTWLKTVKEAGDRFGLGKYTPHIFTTRSGRYYVPNQKLRQEILKLRHDPEVSAMMAGAFTQKNSEFIAAELGRKPTPGELYIAHFLGPKGASDLISLADRNPSARADRHFPRAARANRGIFYSNGHPRTVKQVYNNLVRDHAKLQATAAAKPVKPTPPVAAKTASDPISKPVTESVGSSVPSSGQASSLMQNVSVTGPTDGADIDPILAELGVETEVVEDASSAGMIGLLGQKGSPMAKSKKVAALTHNNLQILPETRTDSAQGSIGTWTTIIEPPAAEKSSLAGTTTDADKADKESAPVKRRPARRKVGARSPRLLEQSASRNTRRSSFRMASAARNVEPNFWEQMSLSGN